MPLLRSLCASALLLTMSAVAFAADSTRVPPDPDPVSPNPRSPYWDLRAPDRVSPDVADSVLWAIQRATAARYVRYNRVRNRASSGESEVGRDSTLVSSSWLLQLERACGELPPSPCRTTSLVPGQTYAYNIRIAAADAAGAPRVEFDFRGLCVRFVRDGRVVAGRTMIGREREMVALLRRASPQDARLEQLADAFQPPPTIQPPPPSEPPAVGEYVYVEELPEPIHREAPVYPQAAVDAGVEGTVTVQVLLDKNGLVVKTQVTKGVPLLNEAAEACARKWTFKPALSQNKPVMVWVAVPIAFKLH